MIRRLLPLLLMLSTACVEDLSVDDPEDTGETSTDPDDTDADTEDDGPIPVGEVRFTDLGDGEMQADVNAADATQWVYVDLVDAARVEAGEPWTLALQRYHIKLNGGVSGDGSVEAAFVPDLAFDDATEAPADGWFTDEPDADDDGEPERAFATWWDYDPSTHVLTPKPGTWFVRDAEQTWAVEILDYYSEFGDSGYPSFRFKGVE